MSEERPAGPASQVRDLLRPVRLDRPTPGTLAGRAALSTLGVVLQGLVRFVYTLLVARVLGADALATTNAAISLALLVSLLWPTAAGAAASKFVAISRGAGDLEETAAVARHLGRWTLYSSLLLAAGAAAYGTLVLDQGPVAAACTALLVIAYSGYGYVRGVQFGVGQVARATIWDAISSAVAIALLVAVLLADLQPLLLLPLSVGYLVYTVTGWPRCRTARLPRRLRREVDGFVGITVVGILASTGVMQGSMLVAERVDTRTAAGYYAAALALATPASLVSRSLSLVLFPSMAEAHGRGDTADLRRQTDVATRGLLVVMTAVLGSVMLLSGPLIALLYSAEFAPAAQLLPMQILAVLCIAVGVASVNRLSSTSQAGARAAVGASLVGALAAGVLWLLFASAGGVAAVAAGLVVWGALTGLLPITMVWVLDRQRWLSPALRWLAGVAVLLLTWWEVRDAAWWVAGVATAGFLLVWALLSVADLRLLLAGVRRRSSTAG